MRAIDHLPTTHTIALIPTLPADLSLHSTYNNLVFPVTTWDILFLLPTVTSNDFNLDAGIAVTGMAYLSTCMLGISA
jgi:hypothetical protein